MICKKEWNQFFSSLTGYIALVVFLLLNGLMFFVFPDTSLLDFGYASLDGFFFAGAMDIAVSDPNRYHAQPGR